VRRVAPSSGNHCVCYCEDCQAFAHFLGRAGEILDVHGGTEIMQVSQATLEIVAGRERVACMRLTPGGLLRWYASCCNTPIGNTLATRAVPFIGVIRLGIREPAVGPVTASMALGPIRAHAYRRSAKGGPPGVPRGGSNLSIALRIVRLMLTWRLRGDHRRSPLLDPVTGTPIAVPRVLSTSEREALRMR